MPPVENDMIIDVECFQKSRKLALYVIRRHRHEFQRKDRTGEKLYELCTEVKYKHDQFFENVGHELGLNEQNFEELSNAVMGQVLNGNCNFGRIISIYAFSLALSDFCIRNNLGDRIESIATNVALTIQGHVDWFKQKGSWDGFMDHFTPQSPEDKIWRGMMITTVGLGAVAGLIYAHS